MPLSPEIGAIDDAFAISTPVGASFPGGFFVMELVSHGARADRHSPESAGAPDVSPVRDEDQLLGVRAPSGREILIMDVVVVTRESTEGIGGDSLDRAQLSGGVEVGHIDVPASLVRGGDEGELTAVR
jgi:hypothetical protein